MALSSVTFIFFIVVCLLIYYILPKKFQWVVLLFASYIFYASYDISAIVYIVLTTITTYFAAKKIHSIHNLKCENNKKDKQKRKAKIILILTLIINFGMLVIFKYSNSIIDNINAIISLTDVSIVLSKFQLLLPIGISFYIFQSMGYLIDIYRKKYEPEKNVAKFALFVSYFPQIIQGPINKFDLLAKQLYQERSFSFDNMRSGLQLILWGLLKKMIVADMLYASVCEIYSNYMNYSGIVIFIGVVIYCIQLYCDFSGGIDIARGVSELFGIKMMNNFNSPYLATSIADFWRRWHISLGEWMKDYVFYSLALSKFFGKIGKTSRNLLGNDVGKKIPVCIATFITFIFVGMWQGPGWSNIAYGMWNGGLMSMAILMSNSFKKMIVFLRIKVESMWYRAFQIVRTFFLVAIGRYFSGSVSLMASFGMLKATLVNVNAEKTFIEQLAMLGLTFDKLLILFISIIILFIVAIVREKTNDNVREVLNKKNWIFQAGITFVSIFVLLVFVYFNIDYVPIEFIYANV